MSEPPVPATPAGSGSSAAVRTRSAPSRAAGGQRRSAHGIPAQTPESRRLLRLAIVPPLLVATIATAVIGYLLDGGGPVRTGSGAPLGVLAGGLLLSAAIVVGAAFVAGGEHRARSARLTALRRHNARGRAELQSLVRQVESGERIDPPAPPPPARSEGDGLDLLGQELAAARHAAETAVVEAAAAARGSIGSSAETVEVFVNLARRLQSLVHREIEHLDELENQVEDPELLKGLFHVDHLATRIRRHAENLAVLGGATSRRQWSRPVGMTEVLRSAIAEVQHYSRVKLAPPIEGTLHGHAVADVIHLLAELVENATVYSAPQTQVLLRAQHVTAGLAVEVEDRGLGMTAAEQNRMNALLSGAERIDVGSLLQDGRIGLFVVASLARRHNIVVQLQNNIYGGVQAVLVLPHELLGDHGREEPARRPAGADAAAAPAAAPADPATAAPRAPLPRRPVVVAALAGTAPVPGLAPVGTPAPAANPAPVPPPAPVADPATDPAPSVPVAPPAPPTPAADPAPAGVAAQPAGGKPALPRRRKQEHLAAELRTGPPVPEPRGAEAGGHDPGLMAAFRRGASLADGADH